MRVTHIITRLIVGGAQENTIASVLGLRARADVQVNLISGPSTGPEGSLQDRVDRFPGFLTLVPSLVRPVRPLTDWIALRRLTALLAAEQPEIVHTHSGKAGILGRIAASRARIPVIVHTVHGPSFGPFQGAVPNAVFRAAERYASRVTTHFVVVADAMRRQYLAAGIGDPDQYTTVWSGFPLEPYTRATNDRALRAKYGIDPTDLVIGKIARLFDLKGHDDLIRIAPALIRSHPNCRFLLVGDGPLRPKFESTLRDLGIDKYFVFTGLVDPSAVPALVGIMDVLVHLSFREGLPRALAQALAAAKPVLAYDCDGAGEICLDNRTGFLIPAGDVQQLQTKLSALLASPDLRERFGQAGQRLVLERFDVDSMVNALHALYLRLLASQRRENGANRVPAQSPNTAVD